MTGVLSLCPEPVAMVTGVVAMATRVVTKCGKFFVSRLNYNTDSPGWKIFYNAAHKFTNVTTIQCKQRVAGLDV